MDKKLAAKHLNVNGRIINFSTSVAVRCSLHTVYMRASKEPLNNSRGNWQRSLEIET